MGKWRWLLMIAVAVFAVGVSVYALPPQEICEATKPGHQDCAAYSLPLFVWIELAKFAADYVALFTVATGAAIAAFTYTLWRATDKLWTAGERQLTHSEDTRHAELRAYLDFDGVWFLRDQEEKDTSEEVCTGIKIKLRNYGKTPAKQIMMSTAYFVVSPHMAEHKVAFDTDKQFSYLMPSDDATSNGRFNMPRMIWQAIDMELAQVRVEAQVQFVDYLESPHSIECVFESYGTKEELGFVAGTRKID